MSQQQTGLNAKTILLVEDDRDIAGAVAMVLETEGYEVNIAAHGGEALTLIENGMPGVILLDMWMPIMDGSQFAQEYLKRYGAVKRAPIVVMSAAADVQKRSTEINADGWIKKPFSMEALLAEIKRFE